MKKLVCVVLLGMGSACAMEEEDPVDLSSLMARLPMDITRDIVSRVNPTHSFSAQDAAKIPITSYEYEDAVIAVLNPYTDEIVFNQPYMIYSHNLTTKKKKPLFKHYYYGFSPITGICFDQESNHAVVIQNHTLSFYEKINTEFVSTKRCVTQAAHQGYYSSAALSASGTLLAVATSDGRVSLSSVDSFFDENTVMKHADPVHSIAISKNAKVVATGKSGNIFISTPRGDVLQILPADGAPKSLALNKKGTILMVGQENGCAVVWDTKRGVKRFVCNEHMRTKEAKKVYDREPTCVAISHDESFAVTNWNNNHVCIWDMASGKLLALIPLYEVAYEQHTKMPIVQSVGITHDDSAIVVIVKKNSTTVIAHIGDISGYKELRSIYSYLPICGLHNGDKKTSAMLRLYFFNKLNQARAEKKKLLLDSGLHMGADGKRYRGFLYTIHRRCLNDYERNAAKDYLEIKQKSQLDLLKEKGIMAVLRGFIGK